MTTVYVLMVVNGVIRFLYLGVKKIQEWALGNYDVGERGELVNYDDRSPVKASERIAE